MTKPLDSILKELNEDFETTVALFSKEDWKLFKFGPNGPYKRTLTRLQKKSYKYDSEILSHFMAYKDIVSYESLIQICLKNEKDLNKKVENFRKLIKKMRKLL